MSNKNDSFGNRMKYYEKEASQKALKGLPICIRLDGKNFSKLTQSLERPFCKSFHDLMCTVSEELLKETNAAVAYTQSDEISLILYTDTPFKTQLYFDGKYNKINSVLASFATYHFNDLKKSVPNFLSNKIPLFDCRSWQVPNVIEAVNNLVWRELDAYKNSISMLARSYFSHQSLLNLSCNQMMDKLVLEKDVNWAHQPASFKRGTYIINVQRKLTEDELKSKIEKIPFEYRDKALLELKKVQKIFARINLPPILKIKDLLIDRIMYGSNSFTENDLNYFLKMNEKLDLDMDYMPNFYKEKYFENV